jgi:ATP-dependent helicase YprA (DUF1998 family)
VLGSGHDCDCASDGSVSTGDDTAAAAGVCNLHPHRDRPPCLDSTPLTPPELLEHLKQGSTYEGQMVHVERMAPRVAEYQELRHSLHACVWAALQVLGVRQGRLFSHQVEAISTLLDGRHVSVCTSTASGKSLCYLVPILQVLLQVQHHPASATLCRSSRRCCNPLHTLPGRASRAACHDGQATIECCRRGLRCRGAALLQVAACMALYNMRGMHGAHALRCMQALASDSEACALLMFPTKALAQDQRAAIERLLEAAFPGAAPPVDVYDGDTPQADRPGIRARARVLMSNPDMLHVSLLPAHSAFARFLRNLRYIVVDESHVYRGAFGAHTAAVLRRLQRICKREYAVTPLFAMTSATSADPATHARALLGVHDVCVVTRDGSPHGPRLFVLWNPPLAMLPRMADAPKAAGVAKGGGPRRAWRMLERKKAAQEASRTATRQHNYSRSGALSVPVASLRALCQPPSLTRTGNNMWVRGAAAARLHLCRCSCAWQGGLGDGVEASGGDRPQAQPRPRRRSRCAHRRSGTCRSRCAGKRIIMSATGEP